jgi:hypothetical protein
MKILGPRLINNENYLLFVEGTAMDPTRKRKLSSPASITTGDSVKGSNDSITGNVDNDGPSSRKTGKKKRKQKVVEKLLGEDYQPNDNDVLCARGKDAATHPGNVRFRSMIDSNLERYHRTDTKKEKTTIVCKIIDSVRSSFPPGKFVRKHSDGLWYDAGDDFAREKIGQCFRDRLHTEYRSSSKAKISRRKESIVQSITSQISAKPIDFDEFVASPDLAHHPNPLHLVTPSLGLQRQSARHSTEYGVSAHTSTGDMPPPSSGDFSEHARRRTNFQGLADIYFGDTSNNSPNSTFPIPARPDRQQHLDLLGSLTQSSRDSTRNFHNAMFSRANVMDQSLRSPDVNHYQHFDSGSIFSHNMQDMTYSRSNADSFASFPTNFMTDRSMELGIGDTIAVRDVLMDQSQPTSRPTTLEAMGHRNMGDMGLDMAAMGAAKGLEYMHHQDANWQSRTERMPPPMLPSMFETSSFATVLQSQESTIAQALQTSSEATRTSPDVHDSSSGESSRIPDDEPLPLH